VIGLAILDADVAIDGDKLDVAVEGGTASATVDHLSSLDPKKERPRA
jgi:glycine cleavage system aminomethyltransferase T